MLQTSCVARRAIVLIALALGAGVLIQTAPAQSINLSLNVFRDDPEDPLSGGVWNLVGKSTGAGILGLDVRLSGVTVDPQAVGPRGIVNGSDPAGFSTLIPYNLAGGVTGIVIGQNPIGAANLGPGEEETVFYNVGSMANGTPSGFSSLTNTAAIPWAAGVNNESLGDPAWNTAVLFATGTFAASATPSFSSGSTGNVFTSVGTSTSIGPSTTVMGGDLTTIVREALACIPGDFNCNGAVENADLTLLLNNWGTAVPPDPPGWIGNPLPTAPAIDNDELTALLNNWGQVAGGGSALAGGPLALAAPAAVPEPGSCSLLVGAAALLVLRKRFRFLRNV